MDEEYLYEDLLNKEELRKIELLRLLESSSHLSLPKKRVADELGISDFVLKSTVEMLIMDIEKFRLSDCLDIKIEDAYVQLTSNDSVNSNTLFDKYLRESLSFEMIFSIFMERYKSINDFSLNQFVSYPIGYNKFKLLNQIFKRMGFEINRRFAFLADEELDLRNFLVKLFARVLKDDYSIYESMDLHLVFETVDRLAANYPNMTYHAKTELTHYLIITDIRNQRKYTLKETLKLKKINSFFRMNELDETVSAYISPFCDKSGKGLEEAVFATYLFSKRIIELPDELLKLPKEINHLNDNFIHTMIQTFGTVDEELDDMFKKELTIIHLNLFFELEGNHTVLRNKDFDYFEHVFPEFYYFTKNYIKEHAKKNRLLKNYKTYFCYQYIFLLVNHISLKRLVKPVLLYLDFSYGSSYNNYVQKFLAYFELVGAEITESLEQADILLTDDSEYLKDEADNTHTFLISSLNFDWSALLAKILQFREKKYVMANTGYLKQVSYLYTGIPEQQRRSRHL